MTSSRSRLGAAGEACAARHLENLGLRILSRNYRAADGEVDIIAEVPEGSPAGHPGEVVFCEVKTRDYARDAEPMLEAVPQRKRGRLVRAALAFCQERRLDPFIRFDVLAVAPDPTGALRVVEHIPHAFTCEGLDPGF